MRLLFGMDWVIERLTKLCRGHIRSGTFSIRLTIFKRPALPLTMGILLPSGKVRSGTLRSSFAIAVNDLMGDVGVHRKEMVLIVGECKLISNLHERGM